MAICEFSLKLLMTTKHLRYRPISKSYSQKMEFGDRRLLRVSHGSNNILVCFADIALVQPSAMVDTMLLGDGLAAQRSGISLANRRKTAPNVDTTPLVRAKLEQRGSVIRSTHAVRKITYTLVHNRGNNGSLYLKKNAFLSSSQDS